MTPEEFTQGMLDIREQYNKTHDEEQAHVDADGLLCDCLNELGYRTGVDIFWDIPKWYA